MRNKILAEQFANGVREGKGSNMFIDKNVIYSYGRHFPIAVRLWNDYDFVFIVTTRKYSSSTSRHTTYVKSAIGDKKIIYKDALNSIIFKGITELKELLADELQK